MASSNRCSLCPKGSGTCFCPGCKAFFCDKDFKHHRGILFNGLDELTEDRNELQEKINKISSETQSGSSLLSRINEWQEITIGKVKQAAEQARQQALEIMNSKRGEITRQFQTLSQELEQLRETEGVLEQDLARLKQQIDQLNNNLEQLCKPSAVELNVNQSDQIVWNRMIYVEEMSGHAAYQENRPQPRGSIFSYEIPTRQCGICMENRPYHDIYVFDCVDSHKLCYGCYYQSCRTKMNNGEILTCALCTHLLKDGELNQLKISNDQLQIIREYQIKKTFEIYSSRAKGIIKCPNHNCAWVAQTDDPNERFKVQCAKCLSEFCSLCNQQYHYRTNCQQLVQITQRWFFWCATERTRYLTMRAQQDAQFANQLAEYNRQSKQNNQRNNDLRCRYDELMNDEQYKAQNCRICPSCTRVVQRLEGCDSMVCGRDAHGGNVQSGCGTKFNWAQAQPYTAAVTQQPKQTILDLPKPDNPVVHHNGVKCDHCKNDINGIRFDCVHCPALTFCEKCEQEATLLHSRENQIYQQQQHVFKLIMIPEEEANQF